MWLVRIVESYEKKVHGNARVSLQVASISPGHVKYVLACAILGVHTDFRLDRFAIVMETGSGKNGDS